LGALTVVVAAILLGWFLHDWLGSEEVVVSVDRPVQVYAPETVVDGHIPNVIGLSEDDARRVLSDAGIELSKVTTSRLPYVGPADLVVTQTPPSGGAIGDREIALAVSEPALMPDLEGMSESEARDSLSSLGARIATASEYQAGAAEGSVLATEPAPGATIVDKATLHVAEPLSSVFLTELPPAASSCRSGEESVVAGTTASEAIVCQPEAGANPRSATYALGGQVESFQAVLGLDDEGDASVPVEFRVYVDGELALSRRLGFGDSLPIEVPLSGAFQLRLETVAAGVSPPGSSPLQAVFAEPRLAGSRSAIDEISEGLGG
jgi:hypothetical protein